MDENKEEPKTIHTYQTDVEEAIKRENISHANVFVAEQKKEKDAAAFIKSNVKPSEFSFNLRSIIAAIIFLVLAGAGFYYFYNSQTQVDTLPPVAIKNAEESILTYDSYESVKIQPDGKREDLLNYINISNQKYTSNGVEVFSFGLTSDQFLYMLAPDISGAFVRSLNPPFAFGLVGNGGQTGPIRAFIIFKVGSYASAKGNLLSEEGNLVPQFSDIFDIPSDPNLRWRDRVIDNHDARILVDHENNVKFLYSFVDSDTLVFAEDDDTFKIIIDRVNSARR